jgi:predicted MFS family arabinose efflux permease
MLGAAVATSWGLRAPFAAAAFLLALVAVWVAYSLKPRQNPQESSANPRQ